MRVESQPLVSMTNVDKYYGDFHALKNINLISPRGEVVVVIGPSGSGKSTLCRTINRLETITSGTITIDGKELPPRRGAARAAPLGRRHGLPVLQPLRPQHDPRERDPRTDQGPGAHEGGGG